jgi:hypothetical protein
MNSTAKLSTALDISFPYKCGQPARQIHPRDGPKMAPPAAAKLSLDPPQRTNDASRISRPLLDPLESETVARVRGNNRANLDQPAP